MVRVHGATWEWTRAAAAAAVVTLLACSSSPAQQAARAADSVRTASGGTVGPPSRDWKKPTQEELKARLTPLQYFVTQKEGTETAFHNVYWDNHAAGIYVDIVSGEVLFSSLDKYDSGTGWPSFTRPLVPENVKTKADHSLMDDRTEVRSAKANSHLGHVFDDGPPPTGLRYCMNSAAMRFIPVAEMEAAGYGNWVVLFARK
jgi:methionine-R-sulfoxide reductase